MYRPFNVDSVNIGISPNAVDLQESDGAVGISITKTAISECALQSVLIISDPSNVDQALEGITTIQLPMSIYRRQKQSMNVCVWGGGGCAWKCCVPPQRL